MAIINSILNWRMKKRFHQIELFMKYPIEIQKDCLTDLLSDAKNTEFGKKYDFASIKSIKEFQNRIPIQDYDDIKDDVSRIMKGEQNILWPSQIKWFAKSSGTTSDKSKFIPVSNEALYDCHYKGGKDLLSIYCNSNENSKVFTGKTIMMGGSNEIINNNKGAYHGDLSAIIIENLPFWVNYFSGPDKDVLLMGDWEKKIQRIAEGTIDENITSISGVPSWTLVLFNYIIEKTGAKNIKEIWPNLELYMHGAVNFQPYLEQFNDFCPGLNYMESYNASEGYFGIQLELGVPDFLLMLDYGVFYEFIPIDHYHNSDDPKVLTLEDVEIGINYVIIITTNAGLWRYAIGDTIEFTGLYPFRFKITGRTKHFINAFGEELIIENAENALAIACAKTNSKIKEYTAAPMYFENDGNGAHEWLIEFEEEPDSLSFFTDTLDNALKAINSDYEAKRFKNMILGTPQIRIMPTGTFYDWLKSKNKLGGQNKVPRLANNRKYVDEILALHQKNN